MIDAVPLLPGYRWHWIARLWRTRGLGEVAVGALTAPVLRTLLRLGFAGKVPPQFVDDIVRFLDGGTQRSILKLYRCVAARGARGRPARDLGALTCPALVVWGDRDPYIQPRFADAYAAALGSDAEVVHLPDAGHWPWHDRPDVVDTRRGVPRRLGCCGAPPHATLGPERRPGGRLPADRPAVGRPRRAGPTAPSCSTARASCCGTTPGTAATTCPATACCSRRWPGGSARALVGALSAVAAAWLFERLAAEHFGERARVGAGGSPRRPRRTSSPGG